ncbi:MAG: hypothetical protein PHE15_00475, partial [Dehalococcoidales bacterium]|nr:hypothetical protein [Dehalococcoidales bacterium]
VEKEETKKPVDAASEEKTVEGPVADAAESIAKPKAKRKTKVEQVTEEATEKPAKPRAKKKDTAEEV